MIIKNIKFYEQEILNSFYKEDLLKEFVEFNSFACEHFILEHFRHNHADLIEIVLSEIFAFGKNINFQKWNLNVYQMEVPNDINEFSINILLSIYQKYKFNDKVDFGVVKNKLTTGKKSVKMQLLDDELLEFLK